MNEPFRYPPDWVRGQLLDHQLFDNGESRCKLLSEQDIEKTKYISFSCREDAQAFISWWYAPASVRMMEREFDGIPRPPHDIQR